MSATKRGISGTAPPRRRRSPATGPAGALLTLAALLAVGAAAPGELGAQVSRFDHADHGEIDCATCHGTGEATESANRRWCQQCHHEEEVARGCVHCHDRQSLLEEPRSVEREMSLSVEPPETRSLPFRHGTHRAIECGSCHTDPPSLGAEQLSCTGCHDEHHAPERTCTACHREPPADAHPVEEAHLTCSGSGCHEPAPFPEPLRSRSSCLACHGEMTDHHPAEECTGCHVLPPPQESSRPEDPDG